MIEREINLFVLRFLNDPAFRGRAVGADNLKASIRAAFPAAFSDGDLMRKLELLEKSGYIAGTVDDLDGLVYALTPEGKIKIQNK
ncbi:MAG TPA: hypothetical protein VIK53_11645 [Verrucomicrobiae bacterium]